MLLKEIIKKTPIISNHLKLMRRIFLKNKFFYFLSRKTTPLSEYCGFDRGKPLDRFFIESFLEKEKYLIKGACLEILSNNYTLIYGEDRVTRSEALDIDTTNKKATIYGDIRDLKNVPDEQFDCLILTQFFQFIDNLDVAIKECHRILKKDGVILATFPSISRIDCTTGTHGDFWRFTTASVNFLFKKYFNENNLKISSLGNVRSGIYFFAGAAIEDTSKKILEANDPDFPNIITLVAKK